MKHLLDLQNSFILLVDVQERLLPSMHASEQVLKDIETLLSAGKMLDISMVSCEQYPKGLGNTVSALQEFQTKDIYEKTIFSACGNASLVEEIKSINKKQCVICGIETHVCILQSVSDLLDEGYEVFIPYETVSSRTLQNKNLALDRMRSWGAQITSLEQVFFEWLKDAKNPKFKEIASLIK